MSFSLINHHKDLTECSIFSTVSWEQWRFIPAPDQLQPVHPVPSRTVFCVCEDLSEGSALQPTDTSMWLAPECILLSLLLPYFYVHHTSYNDDDRWGDRSVVIHPFVQNSFDETWKIAWKMISRQCFGAGNWKTCLLKTRARLSCTFSTKAAYALATQRAWASIH